MTAVAVAGGGGAVAVAVAVAGGGVIAGGGAVRGGVIAGDRAFGMGRLIGPLPKPNDGTVTVAETRLPGATDHIVLPVTHLSMLWSGAVADEVIAFLRDGRFDRQ